MKYPHDELLLFQTSHCMNLSAKKNFIECFFIYGLHRYLFDILGEKRIIDNCSTVYFGKLSSSDLISKRVELVEGIYYESEISELAEPALVIHLVSQEIKGRFKVLDHHVSFPLRR